MLNVQKFLLSQVESGMSQLEALASLKNKFKLKINFSFYKKERCVILSYSQTESPKENEIVRECRGLILSSDFTRILCKPFTRFFNYGEFAESAKGFEFKHAVVSEKVDGTLVSFYFHPYLNRWCCSTRNKAFAEGEVSGWKIKFSELVEKAFDMPLTSGNLESFFSGFENFTFSFEFVSPQNKVVKKYSECSLYFLCMHSNVSGEYVEDGKEIFERLRKRNGLFEKTKFPMVYRLSSYSDIMSFMGNLEDTDEGFVCYDKVHGIRVKVKNPKYVEIASKRINGAITKEKLLKILLDNEKDEYLSYFPEDKYLFDEIEQGILNLKKSVLDAYGKVQRISGKKEFALAVGKSVHSSFLFKLKSGLSFTEILRNIYPKKLANMI